MPQTKTHFEQIPLETVKKIVEEQLQQEEGAETRMREDLRFMTQAASEQCRPPEVFDVPILPRILVSGRLSPAQGITFEEIEKALGGLQSGRKIGPRGHRDG